MKDVGNKLTLLSTLVETSLLNKVESLKNMHTTTPTPQDTLDDEDFIVTAFTRSNTVSRPSYAFQDPQNIAQEMSQIPLFMTELPENAEDNIQLQALQQLLYEGTPEEVANNFREQGNERYGEAIKERETKRRSVLFRDAIMFYGKGLDQDDITDELSIALLLNRAAANMSLQNYGLVKKDCLRVLEKDVGNAKARMRLVNAYLSLGQLEEAEECLEGMPNLEEGSSALSEREKLRAKLAEKRSKQRTTTTTSPIDIALTSRGLTRLVGVEKHILSELPSMTNVPSATLLPNGMLVFPVILLYPQYGESDFIQYWEEGVTIREQLECVFESRAPWDIHNLYTDVNGMSAFVKSVDGAMLGVSVESSPGSLLGTVIKHYESSLLGLYIVPTLHSQAFASKFSTRVC